MALQPDGKRRRMYYDLTSTDDSDEDIVEVVDVRKRNDMFDLTIELPTGSCPICLEDYTYAEKDLRCGHRFHRSCLKTHIISTSIESGTVPVPCPCCPPGPSHSLDDSTIKDHLSAREYRKYLMASVRVALQSDARFKPCQTPDCPYYAFVPAEMNQKLEARGWHTGVSCPLCFRPFTIDAPSTTASSSSSSSSRASSASTHDDFAAYAQRAGFRQCRQCAFWIQKRDGCAKMRCRCGYKFCYECGRKDAACKCTPSNHHFLPLSEVRQEASPSPRFADVFSGAGGGPPGIAPAFHAMLMRFF